MCAATGMGAWLLRRAFQRDRRLPEEVALGASWIFLAGSLVWLGVYLRGSTLLGFAAPWTWLAAAHFAFAGYGALTVTALCCRAVSDPVTVRRLRILLPFHPVLYLITAGGIMGYRFCDEIGATGYWVLFLAQLSLVVRSRPDRMPGVPGRLLPVALAVPVLTLIPAMAWAWGRPFLGMSGMIHYHGVVNAVGHVGLGLFAFLLGRPASHAALRVHL